MRWIALVKLSTDCSQQHAKLLPSLPHSVHRQGRRTFRVLKCDCCAVSEAEVLAALDGHVVNVSGARGRHGDEKLSVERAGSFKLPHGKGDAVQFGPGALQSYEGPYRMDGGGRLHDLSNYLRRED